MPQNMYYEGERGEWRSGPYHTDPECGEIDPEANVIETLISAVRREDDPEYCPECASQYLPSGSGSGTASDAHSGASSTTEEIVLEGETAAPFDPADYTVDQLEQVDLEEYTEAQRRALLEAEREGKDRTTAIEALGRNVPDGDDADE